MGIDVVNVEALDGSKSTIAYQSQTAAGYSTN